MLKLLDTDLLEYFWKQTYKQLLTSINKAIQLMKIDTEMTGNTSIENLNVSGISSVKNLEVTESTVYNSKTGNANNITDYFIVTGNDLNSISAGLSQLHIKADTTGLYAMFNEDYAYVNTFVYSGGSSELIKQIAYGRTSSGNMAIREKLANGTWTSWNKIVTMGGGGSAQSSDGAVPISISGNAATASKATTDSAGNTINTYYEPKANVTSKGNATTPVYLDANGQAVAITSYSGNAATATTATSATTAASATKATQDASGNVITSTYYKVSGGSITGGTINRNVDNSFLYLMGGTAQNAGASFLACGKGHSSAPGQFIAYAHNGTTQHYLQGKPDGTLYWSGNLSTAGTITGSKIYNAVYNDYAEWFPKAPKESTQPGDLIAIKTDSENGEEYYIKASLSRNIVVGVHSDEYAHIIGGDPAPEGEDYFEYNLKTMIPVALAGRVWVNAENSKELKIGDLVGVSAIPGKAAKVISKYQAIGIVVRKKDEENKVRIKML